MLLMRNKHVNWYLTNNSIIYDQIIWFINLVWKIYTPALLFKIHYESSYNYTYQSSMRIYSKMVKIPRPK